LQKRFGEAGLRNDETESYGLAALIENRKLQMHDENKVYRAACDALKTVNDRKNFPEKKLNGAAKKIAEQNSRTVKI